MTAKQRRRHALLTWVRDQYATITPRQFAAQLSVESLPDDQLPFHHRRALTEFWHLRTDARIAACKRFEVARKELRS
jgi:hypothetical protein